MNLCKLAHLRCKTTKKSSKTNIISLKNLKFVNRAPDFILFYLGFYVAFNTVQVISRRVVGRAEETST